MKRTETEPVTLTLPFARQVTVRAAVRALAPGGKPVAWLIQQERTRLRSRIVHVDLTFMGASRPTSVRAPDRPFPGTASPMLESAGFLRPRRTPSCRQHKSTGPPRARASVRKHGVLVPIVGSGSGPCQLLYSKAHASSILGRWPPVRTRPVHMARVHCMLQ